MKSATIGISPTYSTWLKASSGGKLHYAEIGRLSKYDPPSKDMLVTLKSQTSIQKQRSRRAFARVFIESYVPFDDLANADGATWLDRKLLSKGPVEFHNKGFGAVANQALRLRQQWLIKEEFLNEQNGRIIACRNMLQKLRQREVTLVSSQLQKELDLEYRPTSDGNNLKGPVTKSLKLTSGRFAVVQQAKEFSLVPWRQATSWKKGANIEVGGKKGISR